MCFRNLAAGLLDEMSKPLKGLVETQVKARKPVSFTFNILFKLKNKTFIIFSGS